MAANALEMYSCDTRASSTIVLEPLWSRMALSSAAALAAFLVVSTTAKPSWANFWAMAPPTPQRTPTGRSLSSISRPWASLVLRPSDCHLEVAPTTTATGRPVELIGILLCATGEERGVQRISYNRSARSDAKEGDDDVDRRSREARVSRPAQRDRRRGAQRRTVPPDLGGHDVPRGAEAGAGFRGRARDDARRGVPPAHRAPRLLAPRQG